MFQFMVKPLEAKLMETCVVTVNGFALYVEYVILNRAFALKICMSYQPARRLQPAMSLQRELI